MKKIYFLFSLFLLLGSRTVWAQSEGFLTGVVLDEKQQPAGFVNVAVVEAATATVVTGAIADMEGRFQIKTPAAGRYQLRISGLGYATFQGPAFEVGSSNFTKDFGKLQVKSDTKVLAEVEIQSMRPTVTTHPDKMVVSVEGTAMAAGSTALEVLEKSPGVWIDQDGNIQLNGKAGVQVMINGKRSFLSGKELQNILQSMTADNIKDLEIITTPSSRHDAEGASGIININLKKGQQAGMTGSVYANYQYNSLSTYSGGAEINHKAGKWNTFGSLNSARRMWYRDADLNRVFTDERNNRSTYDQVAYEESERLHSSLRLGTDYDLSDKHSFGMIGNLTLGGVNGSFASDAILRNGKNENVHSLSQTDEDSYNGTLNLHYLGKLDTLGTTLSADLDYVNLGTNDYADLINRKEFANSSQPAKRENLNSDNPVVYSIYSAKVDFSKKLGKAKVEAGAKTSYVKSDNELQFFEVLDEQRISDPKRSNHFIYEENIHAVYANLSTSLGEKFTLQAGLRAEQTISTGLLVAAEKESERNYLDLFPSVFVQQKVSESYQIGYKYSRRINRPNYHSLNPFIFYIDPYTYATGNPDLKPQYVNSFEVTQTLKQRYNLVLGYAHTKDFIGEVPVQNAETKVTIFQDQNVKGLRSASATLVAPVTISNKWQVSNNIMGMYQEFTNLSGDEVVVKDKVTAIIQSNHSFMLPKNIKLEVNGGYRSPTVYGLYDIEGQWWVDAGLKRSILDDKLSFGLNFTDIFKSRTLNLESNLNGNVNAINQYQGAQSIRFNIRYRFSKGSEFQAKKRDVNLDELNRTGN